MRRRTDCRVARKSWTTRAIGFGLRRCFRFVASLLPVRRRTGSRLLRRGFFVVLPGGRCPCRLRSLTDRLLGHGFARTGDSLRRNDRIGYRRLRATGVLASYEDRYVVRRQAVRETPSRTAYVTRIPVPIMRVTSGPGVPTGASLSHAQRLFEHFPSQTNGFDRLLTW